FGRYSDLRTLSTALLIVLEVSQLYRVAWRLAPVRAYNRRIPLFPRDNRSLHRFPQQRPGDYQTHPAAHRPTPESNKAISFSRLRSNGSVLTSLILRLTEERPTFHSLAARRVASPVDCCPLSPQAPYEQGQ